MGFCFVAYQSIFDEVIIESESAIPVNVYISLIRAEIIQGYCRVSIAINRFESWLHLEEPYIL